MQRRHLIFLHLIVILNLCTSNSPAQTSSFRLQTADSLFQTKRYTQSLEHYEEILRQRQYSPAMLLKMAYIYEGLNQRGSAIYYLNLYYIATNDETVLEKIGEIATKYDLYGYEVTDFDRFWSFYLDNHLYLSFAIAALMILMLSVMYHTRIRQHTRPLASAIVVAFLAILLFAHQQYGTVRARGIIADTSTYVMEGPSAGASVIDIIGDGHRVEILGKKDVWLKIRWDEDIAYVKENSIRPVRL